MRSSSLSPSPAALKNAAPAVTPGRSGLRVLLVALVLGVVTFLLFRHASDNDFINLDDPLYVAKNAHVQQGLSWSTAAWSVRALEGGNWHPLTWLSLLLDARLYGPASAWGYHLTNVLVHTANVMLLFVVLWRLTGALWCSAWVAALFGVHPLHVESVAWISERKDVLSTFFWIAAMGGYALYAEKPTFGRYALVAAALVLGLMSKPMLVTLPCVLLLLDYWPLARLRLGWRRLLAEKVPLFALSILVCAVTWYAQRASRAMSSLRDIPISERIANALVAYGTYIVKMFWPVNLTILYPLRVGQPNIPAACAAALLLIIVSVVVIKWRRQFPYLLVGWCWYLGTLVPVIGLIQVGMQSMADRYTYVPLIGLFIMLAWGGADLARRWRCQEVAVGVAGLVVVLCMLATWLQVVYWHDSVTLWTHALDIDETNAVAHLQLGGRLWELGMQESSAGQSPDTEWQEAIAHYRRCVELDPNLAKGRYNLGVAIYPRGQTAEGLHELEAAVDLQPFYPEAWYALGQAQARQGQYAAAEEDLRKAIEQKPEMNNAWDILGRVLGREGKWPEAVERLRHAVANATSDERPLTYRVGLAWALEQAGRHEEARAEYAAAAQLDPNWPVALADDAWGMATSPEADRRNGFVALELAGPAAAEASPERRPRNLDILAAAYAENGEWDDAIATSDKAQAAAVAAGQTDLAKEIAERRAGYRSHTPFRERPGKSP